MKIKLIRKLALQIDGIDISTRRVGDVFNLAPHDAETLIAEGWAEAVPQRVRARGPAERSEVADKPRRSRRRH
jgi:hypothetical protein